MSVHESPHKLIKLKNLEDEHLNVHSSFIFVSDKNLDKINVSYNNHWLS